jgi:hypothetical protein
MRMAGSARLLRALLRALITGLVALAAGSQLASAQTPTPEQLETFQNLTPEQQRAVLDAMQNGDTATDTVERPSAPTDDEEPISLGQLRGWLIDQGVAAGDTSPVTYSQCSQADAEPFRDVADSCQELRLSFGGLTYTALLLSRGRQDLAIYHAGHRFLPGLPDFNTVLEGPARVLIPELLEHHDVLYVDMPLSGRNSAQKGQRVGGFQLQMHDEFAVVDLPGKSALAYFLTPVRKLVDEMALRYRQLKMLGFSGGGWATSWYAALDPRIAHSVSVAGSVPLSLVPVVGGRALKGDWEQHGAFVYRRVEYTDLYALAAYPQSRTHRLVFNEFDDCCFQGYLGKQAERLFYSQYHDTLSVEFIVSRGQVQHTIPVSLVMDLLP